MPSGKPRHLDSFNLAQIDEVTDSHKNIQSLEQSRAQTPYMPGYLNGGTASSNAYSTKNKSRESLGVSKRVS